MVGCEGNEVGTRPEEWFQRIHPEDLKQVQDGIDTHLAGSSHQFEDQHRLLHKDGTYRWMSCRGVIVRNENGQAVRISGSHSDITAEKVVDELTGLPNRLLLLDRMTRAIARAKRRSDHIFALLLLDLDRPETLIERLGPVASDHLVIAAARRLETCLRAGDTVARLGRDHVVARLGGDVFTILLDGLNEVGEAKNVAERLLKEISAPFELDGRDVFLAASCGIALSVTGYQCAEEVLRDADTALHRAKSLGKSRCEVFDTAILESAQTRLQLEADLQGALARQEFSVFYQPIVSLASSELAGFEALVRWQHPVRGMIAPLDFIPLAERTGLIVPLGRWILHEACRQLKAWQENLRIPQDLWVSVNISSLQFVRPSLVDQIREVLRDLQLAPNCLMLELTEGVLMQNPEAASSLLMELRVMGVQIGLDDFGTGYSSLTYLRQFPVDYLKIDQSFVRRMETGQDVLEIVRTIIGLAQQLGLRVIAEGIENAGQLDVIRSLNCEYGQGFYFSKPVNNESAETLLKEGFSQTQGTIVEKDEAGEITAVTISSFDAPSSPSAADLPMEVMQIEQKKGRFARRRGSLLVALTALVLLLVGGLLAKFNRYTAPPVAYTSPSDLQSPVDTARAAPAAEQTVEMPAIQTDQKPLAHSAPSSPPPTVPKPPREKPPGSDKTNQKPLARGAPSSAPPIVPTPPREEPPGSDKTNQKLIAQEVPLSPPPVVLEPPKQDPPTYSYSVVHEHLLGSCKGTLKISGETLSFESDKEKDGFVLKYSEFTCALDKDKLTIKASAKTYRFKSATARSKEENRSQLQEMVQIISKFHPDAASKRQ
jgi:diguanylate cyclase (GGDEF)-like protein